MKKVVFFILFFQLVLNCADIQEHTKEKNLDFFNTKDKNTKNETTFATKYLEELKNISLPKRSEKKNKRVTNNILKNEPSRNITLYDQLIIDVDSFSNTMTLKGKLNNKISNLQTYVVSTAKKDINKPTGEGNVTSITLNPFWYPTIDTIETFKKRGIDLPKVVPPGNKYNYMGSAKINLTHMVDGKNTFRIHGTLSENTIGTNESSGCIRMKNNEVIQLASLLNKFSETKNINNIKVFLK